MEKEYRRNYLNVYRRNAKGAAETKRNMQMLAEERRAQICTLLTIFSSAFQVWKKVEADLHDLRENKN